MTTLGHAFIHSFTSLSKLVGFFPFLFFRLTSCETGNQVRIMSLFPFVSYCVHYPAECLHLCSIPAANENCNFWPGSQNLIRCPDLTEPSYDSRDHPVVNKAFFMRITRIIVGGECFIGSQWGQSFCHSGAEMKDRREQKLLSPQVVQQLNWK